MKPLRSIKAVSLLKFYSAMLTSLIFDIIYFFYSCSFSCWLIFFISGFSDFTSFSFFDFGLESSSSKKFISSIFFIFYTFDTFSDSYIVLFVLISRLYCLSFFMLHAFSSWNFSSTMLIKSANWSFLLLGKSAVKKSLFRFWCVNSIVLNTSRSFILLFLLLPLLPLVLFDWYYIYFYLLDFTSKVNSEKSLYTFFFLKSGWVGEFFPESDFVIATVSFCFVMFLSGYENLFYVFNYFWVL